MQTSISSSLTRPDPHHASLSHTGSSATASKITGVGKCECGEGKEIVEDEVRCCQNREIYKVHVHTHIDGKAKCCMCARFVMFYPGHEISNPHSLSQHTMHTHPQPENGEYYCKGDWTEVASGIFECGDLQLRTPQSCGITRQVSLSVSAARMCACVHECVWTRVYWLCEKVIMAVFLFG